MATDDDFAIVPVRRALPQHQPAGLPELLAAGPDFRLHVSDAALGGMRQHATQHSGEEVGGVLLGRHYATDGRYAVLVTDHLPVPSESKSAVHFDFDRSSIGAIFSRLDNGGQDYVVGWYHSHVTGAPFMSQLDHRAHRDHFAHPWYVSCVLGVGEWGVPAGFWRLVEDEIVAVDEYSVHLDSPGSASERHQRFLRACQVGGRSRDRFARTAADVLPNLGVPADGPLGSALRDAAGQTEVRLDSYLGLRLVLDVATRLADDPAAAAEAAALRGRLRRARSYRDALQPVLIAESLGETLALRGEECYAGTPGELTLHGFHLKRSLTWPIDLPSGVVDLSFAPDGVLWYLAEGGRVVQVRGTVADNAFRVKLAMNALPELGGAARELVADDRRLWLRTDERWAVVEVDRAPQGDTELSLGDSGPLPPGDCRLIAADGLRGDSAAPGLVCLREGAVERWARVDGDWRRAARAALPAPWRDWSLAVGCVTGEDLFLLFDDGELGQLGRFDRSTLELSCHYLRGGGEANRGAVTWVGTDGLGRVYVRMGAVLYRVRP